MVELINSLSVTLLIAVPLSAFLNVSDPFQMGLKEWSFTSYRPSFMQALTRGGIFYNRIVISQYVRLHQLGNSNAFIVCQLKAGLKWSVSARSKKAHLFLCEHWYSDNSVPEVCTSILYLGLTTPYL